MTGKKGFNDEFLVQSVITLVAFMHILNLIFIYIVFFLNFAYMLAILLCAFDILIFNVSIWP